MWTAGKAAWAFGGVVVRDGEPLPKPVTVEQTWALLLILYTRGEQTCGFIEYVHRYLAAYEKIAAGDSEMVQKADPAVDDLCRKVKAELETTGVPPHIRTTASWYLNTKQPMNDARGMTKSQALVQARLRWGPQATVWSHRSSSPSSRICYIGYHEDGVIVQTGSGPDWETAFWYADRGITDWPDRPRLIVSDHRGW